MKVLQDVRLPRRPGVLQLTKTKRDNQIKTKGNIKKDREKTV